MSKHGSCTNMLSVLQYCQVAIRSSKHVQSVTRIPRHDGQLTMNVADCGTNYLYCDWMT